MISTIQISSRFIEGDDIGPPAGGEGEFGQSGKSRRAQQAADAALNHQRRFRLAPIGAEFHRHACLLLRLVSPYSLPQTMRRSTAAQGRMQMGAAARHQPVQSTQLSRRAGIVATWLVLLAALVSAFNAFARYSMGTVLYLDQKAGMFGGQLTWLFDLYRNNSNTLRDLQLIMFAGMVMLGAAWTLADERACPG